MPDAPENENEEWNEDPAAITANDRLAKLRMANLVRQYLQAQSLEVLVENGLEDAVMRFVDKDDKDAIKEYVRICNGKICRADKSTALCRKHSRVSARICARRK